MERTFTFETKRSVSSAFSLVALAAFTWWQFVAYVIPGAKRILSFPGEMTSTQYVELMWAPLVGYLLISGNALLLARIFKPLESDLAKSLFLGLIMGLTASLITSLVAGLLAGFLVGLLSGLVFEFKK